VFHKWKIPAPVDLRSEAKVRVRHALDVAEALQGDLTLLYVPNGPPQRAVRVEWPGNAMASPDSCEVRRLVLPGSVRRRSDDTLTIWARTWSFSRPARIAGGSGCGDVPQQQQLPPPQMANVRYQAMRWCRARLSVVREAQAVFLNGG
jgi:hypothetical protein